MSVLTTTGCQGGCAGVAKPEKVKSKKKPNQTKQKADNLGPTRGTVLLYSKCAYVIYNSPISKIETNV